MSLGLFLYLINCFDSMHNLLILFCGIGAFLFIPHAGIFLTDDFQKYVTINTLKYHGITLVVSSLLLVIVPSQRTMYLMLGASYLENSTIPTKVSKIINMKLDEYLAELENK